MIALIFCGDIKYCPYIYKYISRIDKSGQEYIVLFWNRSGFKINLPENYIYFDEKSTLKKNKVSKAFDFYAFWRWAMRELSAIKADKIIVLSTITGVLFSGLLQNFRGRYIFDIRDYSYEHIKKFCDIERRVIRNSYFTAISSEGFKAFLPIYDYVIAHNISREDIDNKQYMSYKLKKNNGKIRYVWNGLIRYFEFQKQFIDSLKNDERFELIYYGDGPELSTYEEYCKKNSINNVTFKGEYNNSEKWKIMCETDILNNCYGYTHNAGNKLKYAVSNKYYDGLIFSIPQVVEGHGYKAKLVENAGVGLVVDSAYNFSDRLYEFYTKLDHKKLDRNCEIELFRILKEDDYYIERIDDFISM